MSRVLRARRTLIDAVVAGGALLLLMVVLSSFDQRVRDQLSLRLGTTPVSSQIGEVAAFASGAAAVVLTAVRDQSIEHAPLVIFVLAASVLMLFMLRT